MAPKTSKTPGPEFVRNALVKLESINVVSAKTGHRVPDREQIGDLKNRFLDGEFGRTVACGVQLLDSEEDGKKLIDDGLSTCTALLEIFQEHWVTNPAAKPNGDLWDCGLAELFQHGLFVKIVRYEDDDDFEAREAWNIAKHDKESTSVAWSTVCSKINIAKKTYAKVQEWAAASVRLRHCIGSGANSNAAIGRWVRAAQSIDDAVLA